ncbi:PLAC8 family-domain-containing protein [Pterulicium gracile]|uniref:PLAC8 family-domain-containing protein n=1 Tax=Pterulicium gracile TaxID=1884261 RepID=A0A5C3Q4X1_9AGAR|nr:PLAC8 family-domain-containing protein [Pterula gracilis]
MTMSQSQFPTVNTHVDEKLTSLNSNQQQPTMTAAMEVKKGGNRNAKNKPLDVYGSRDWSNNLFSCADFKMCLLGCWCPCVAFAKLKRRREYLEENGAADPEHGGPFVSEDCRSYWLLNLCGGGGWAMQIDNRAASRQRYNIRGTHVRDHMSSYCCNSLSMAQESAELALEEESL